MIRGNCRIILGVLVGVMNPQGLLGYLRFCKLCKSYPTLLLCLFTSAFSLWWGNARFILNQQTRCPPLMLCLCLLRLVTKYFKIVSGLLDYKWSGYESDLHSNEHYLSSSEKKAWKNLGLYGIWTHDFCDTGAVLYQLYSNQLPISFLAQLVEHCTGIAEVMGSNPEQAWIFSGLLFTAAWVVFITTKIAFISTSLSAVQIYDFHIFPASINEVCKRHHNYVCVLRDNPFFQNSELKTLPNKSNFILWLLRAYILSLSKKQ